jgi:hypothetical protein
MKIFSIEHWSSLNLIRGVIPIELLHTDINEQLVHNKKVFKNSEKNSEDVCVPSQNLENKISLNLSLFKENARHFRKLI